MSSAPTTPKAPTRKKLELDPESDSPSPKTPRRTPHCKTCGRPRKGHPLRACSSITDSPLAEPADARGSPTNKLIAALGTLILDSDALEERDRQEKRARRKSAAAALAPRPIESVSSVSTVTAEILNSLTKPSVFYNGTAEPGDVDDAGEKRESVVRWREGSGVPPQARGDLSPSPAYSDKSPDLDAATPTKKAQSKRR